MENEGLLPESSEGEGGVETEVDAEGIAEAVALVVMSAEGIVDGGSETMKGVEVDTKGEVAADATGVFGAEEEHVRTMVDGAVKVGGYDAEVGMAEEGDEVVTLPVGCAEVEVSQIGTEQGIASVSAFDGPEVAGMLVVAG